MMTKNPVSATTKRIAAAQTSLNRSGVSGEHFWELFNVPLLGQGETHTIVEIIHSSNREHRHGLTPDSTPGYYSYIWPLTIPDDKKIPDDFDELLNYDEGFMASGLMRSGRIFKQKDFALAIEKALSFIDEIAKIHSQNKPQREEK